MPPAARAEMGGAVQADQLGAAVQVVVRQHLLGRDFHRARVGHVLVEVGESQLHGLDLQVLRLHRVDRHVGNVEAFDDAQGDQGGDALSVRRDLMQLVAAVGTGDRLDPFRAVGAQVFQRHGGAAFLAEGGDALGQLAFVEIAALGGGDAAQRVGRVRKAEVLADLGRAALGHEGLGVARLVAQFIGGGGPLVRHHRRHGIAALGDLDGRFEQLLERQLAELFVQRGPAGHHARHRDRVPAALGLDRQAVGADAVLALEVFDIPRGGGHARGIQAMQFLAVPDDGKAVAPQAAGDRLDQHDGGGGGDGGVDRVTALEQHAQASLGRQGVRRGHHVTREQRDTDGGIRVDPVEGFHGACLIEVSRRRYSRDLIKSI